MTGKENKQSKKKNTGYRVGAEIIRARHSEETQRELKNAGTDPNQINLVWQKISKKVNELCGVSLSSKFIKTKYNFLWGKFKKEKDAVSKSGSSPSEWMYFDIFSETFPKGKKISMENVLETGSGQEVILNEVSETESKDEKTPKNLKKQEKSLKEIKLEGMMLKNEAYKKILNSTEEDKIAEKNRIEIIEIKKKLNQ